MNIISIDPGSKESAYIICNINNDIKILYFDKIKNTELINVLIEIKNIDIFIIEKIVSYNKKVGESIFETIFWTGRFYEAIGNIKKFLISRRDIKMNLCGKMCVNDSKIIKALIKRFAKNTPNLGKGYKNEKGYFYGFKKDIWQAFALFVTFYDNKNKYIINK